MPYFESRGFGAALSILKRQLSRPLKKWNQVNSEGLPTATHSKCIWMRKYWLMVCLHTQSLTSMAFCKSVFGRISRYQTVHDLYGSRFIQILHPSSDIRPKIWGGWRNQQPDL